LKLSFLTISADLIQTPPKLQFNEEEQSILGVKKEESGKVAGNCGIVG
jgi:hypothetical protein